MPWIIGGLFVGLMLAGLTGELIQTQVLHNTTPIAQRGAMSDFIIGGVVWLIIGAVIWFMRWRKKENAKLASRRDADTAAAQRKEQERLRAIEAQESAQRRIYDTLLDKNRYAVAQFAKLPDYLSSAHRCLDVAEQEFRETAYVPFWEAIESATNDLGCFIDCVSSINRAAEDYRQLAQQYGGAADPFAVSLDATARLSVSEGVSQRINQITRPAHRDAEFSQKYLLMRGNSIMVAGFANLGEALSRMTSSLMGALSEINQSVRAVDSSMSGLSDHLGSISMGIQSVDASTKSAEAATRNSATQVSTHFRDLERQQSRSVLMLDNIQRDRKPPFFV